MLHQKIQDQLNEQFHKELFSANLYLAMASWFLDNDLDGFAHFFRLQADEELMHAMKQYDYIHEVEGKVTIGQIDGPDTSYGSILEVMEQALAHEREVTASINAIVKASLEQNDFATHSFFQWFVDEQVEEESTMRSIIAKIKLSGGDRSALYLLNEELLRRKPESEGN